MVASVKRRKIGAASLRELLIALRHFPKLVAALLVYCSNVRGHRVTRAILMRLIDEVVLPLAKAVQP